MVNPVDVIVVVPEVAAVEDVTVTMLEVSDGVVELEMEPVLISPEVVLVELLPELVALDAVDVTDGEALLLRLELVSLVVIVEEPLADELVEDIDGVVDRLVVLELVSLVVTMEEPLFDELVEETDGVVDAVVALELDSVELDVVMLEENEPDDVVEELLSLEDVELLAVVKADDDDSVEVVEKLLSVDDEEVLLVESQIVM